MPTLIIGDHLVADITRPGATPNYGEIVVFRHPRYPNTTAINRVIGLPGDRVQLRLGVLYLNGKAVPRTPIGVFTKRNLPVDQKVYRETLPNGHSYSIMEISDEAQGDNTQEYIVPSGRFFVLGDNRDDCLDSRLLDDVGYIPIANVIGTARTIYWADDKTRLFTRIE